MKKTENVEDIFRAMGVTLPDKETDLDKSQKVGLEAMRLSRSMIDKYKKMDNQ